MNDATSRVWKNFKFFAVSLTRFHRCHQCNRPMGGGIYQSLCSTGQDNQCHLVNLFLLFFFFQLKNSQHYLNLSRLSGLYGSTGGTYVSQNKKPKKLITHLRFILRFCFKCFSLFDSNFKMQQIYIFPNSIRL